MLIQPFACQNKDRNINQSKFTYRLYFFLYCHKIAFSQRGLDNINNIVSFVAKFIRNFVKTHLDTLVGFCQRL